MVGRLWRQARGIASNLPSNPSPGVLKACAELSKSVSPQPSTNPNSNQSLKP